MVNQTFVCINCYASVYLSVCSLTNRLNYLVSILQDQSSPCVKMSSNGSNLNQNINNCDYKDFGGLLNLNFVLIFLLFLSPGSLLSLQMPFCINGVVQYVDDQKLDEHICKQNCTVVTN